MRIANDSIYGLSGAVVSASEERALAVARRIRTGTLADQRRHVVHVDTPFGGYKQSGIGRENGVAGFEEYLETKVMALPEADSDVPGRELLVVVQKQAGFEPGFALKSRSAVIRSSSASSAVIERR